MGTITTQLELLKCWGHKQHAHTLHIENWAPSGDCKLLSQVWPFCSPTCWLEGSAGPDAKSVCLSEERQTRRKSKKRSECSESYHTSLCAFALILKRRSENKQGMYFSLRFVSFNDLYYFELMLFLGFWLWSRSSALVSIKWRCFLTSTRALVLRSTTELALTVYSI